MAQTRKKRMLTEQFIRSKLTTKNYDIYLDKNFYYGEDPFKLPADDDWDPKTGSCAMHAVFTIEALGNKITEKTKQYKGFHEVTPMNIESIMNKLDSGYIIELLHVYRNKSFVETLPRNNVYDSHDFILVKGGSKYFLSQGFQFAYKHSLTSYTREQVITMLHDILTYLCDYNNNKSWKDLDLSFYKKYFKADLLVGKMDQLKVSPNKKVNGIVLEFLEIKQV
jgi:hypothetical protein